MQIIDEVTFESLGLSAEMRPFLESLKFEKPTAVQAKAIPPMLAGGDVIVQAQTGTGKTAAFALPILQNLRPHKTHIQCLVLTPTRELAMQVADAFRSFGQLHKGLNVASILGGNHYQQQIRSLKDGAQVVVGTPGRVMDLMRRGHLCLANLHHLVLDEADEMLRMGFVEDVEWILSHTPDKKQIAMFSATMPGRVRKIATQFLCEATEVTLQQKTATVDRIRQRYLVVREKQKLDVLVRLLEAEADSGVIIFARTKNTTLEIAEKLNRFGFKTEALNGDMTQDNRKRTVAKLKAGQIDIVVATDVAARGIDIERIGLVINHDMPFDNETYVHRIGRTGRAGRTGDAIMLVEPREQRLLKQLERVIKTNLELMKLPSIDVINQKRIEVFQQAITTTLEQKDLSFYQTMLKTFAEEADLEMVDVAAALASLSQNHRPLLLTKKDELVLVEERRSNGNIGDKRQGRQRGANKRISGIRGPIADKDMVRYRLAVGRRDGVKPGNIVGAIANEAGIDSQHIGHIKINDRDTLVDLPPGMSKAVLQHLKTAYVCGKKLNIVPA